MEDIVYTTKLMWSQIDSNNHLRHSAYSDLACQARVELLNLLGLTTEVMKNLDIGPILFEEKTVYKREVPPNATVNVTCMLASSRSDIARWSFVQEIYRDDGVLAAVVTTVGAWLHLSKRKLCIPPEEFAAAFLSKMKRTPDCEIYSK